MDGKYVSLTSFRRDGRPVATPVWFVQDDERLLVSTAAASGKVRRIARNPKVTVAPCTASGRLRGEPLAAHAEVLDPERVPELEPLMARKYRLDRAFVLPIYRFVQWLRAQPVGGDGAVVAITLDGASSAAE